MKVLYVDQLAKTSGCYSIPQADYIFNNENIEISEFISDNIDFSLEKFRVPVIKGFHGAYEGSAFNKVKNYLRGLKELRNYIVENSIEILHLQWFSLPWFEWIYVKELKKHCKIIITIHDVIPFNCRPLEITSLDAIYKSADYLLFHSEHARIEFERNYKTRVRTEIITQGFCSKKNYELVNKASARAYFSIGENKTVILFYGTIRKSKGLDTLLVAFNKAYKRNQDLFLLIGGAFNKIDEVKYRELTSQCVDETNSRINYKFVPTEEEPLYFSAADIMCLPYRELTQSGVAQNALTYELPIIATDVGDMKEVVRVGYNGELFDIDDTDQLANIMVRMSRMPDLLKKYSKGSKYLGENEFSLEKKSEIVAAVYRKAVLEQ